MNPGSFFTGLLDGVMGGLLGLGGAALRVPRLAGVRPPQATVLRDAGALVVMLAAWMCRAKVVPLEVLATHLDIVLCLLAGSLAGAALAARRARAWCAILVFLAGLSLAVVGVSTLAWGVLAGAAVGIVMGYTAGGPLLLVPVLVVLFDLDIKVAGSLALMVSVPMVLAGLFRVSGAATLAVLRQEKRQCVSAACGAVMGAALGALLLGLLPSRALMTLLEALLVYAAMLNFVIFPRHADASH